MLTSIQQVNTEFFRTFFNLKMVFGGEEKVVLCRYAKKSSHDYVEEQPNQIYPCIAIQDFTPTIKKEWYVDLHAYFAGKSIDDLTGYLYMRPIWMEFRYDVSIVAKSYNEFITMQDYFMEHFVYGKRFLFNKKLSGEDEVGDVVPYEIRETDVPRTDGVFEMNYEFTCSVWLYPRKPEEVTLVQNIVIHCAPKGTEFEDHVITKDDKVLFTNDGAMIGVASEKLDIDSTQLKKLFETAVTSEDVDTIKVVDGPEDISDKDDRTLYVSPESS